MCKKLWIFLFSLTLCGCSPAGVEPGAIADHYTALTEVTMEAAVSTVTGPVIDFELRVTRSGGEDTVLILAPEGVAGITARIGADRTVLEYQGAAAETLLPGVPGFTPCDAVTGLLDDLAHEVPVSANLCSTGEGEAIQLNYARRLADGTQTEKLVWLTPEYRLQRAEFFLAGSLVMTLQVK